MTIVLFCRRKLAKISTLIFLSLPNAQNYKERGEEDRFPPLFSGSQSPSMCLAISYWLKAGAGCGLDCISDSTIGDLLIRKL